MRYTEVTAFLVQIYFAIKCMYNSKVTRKMRGNNGFDLAKKKKFIKGAKHSTSRAYDIT
jgi:hypothetical protein